MFISSLEMYYNNSTKLTYFLCFFSSFTIYRYTKCFMYMYMYILPLYESHLLTMVFFHNCFSFQPINSNTNYSLLSLKNEWIKEMMLNLKRSSFLHLLLYCRVYMYHFIKSFHPLFQKHELKGFLKLDLMYFIHFLE